LSSTTGRHTLDHPVPSPHPLIFVRFLIDRQFTSFFLHFSFFFFVSNQLSVLLY
jgi:hypothetical protein